MEDEPKKKKKRKGHIFSSGLKNEFSDFFEDIAILLHSGIDLVSSIRVIYEETRRKRFKKVLGYVLSEIEAGVSFSAVLRDIKVVDGYVLALIETGERSGRLPENLKTAVEQQKRLHTFFSSVRGALIYPAVVLVLTASVGLATAWFILPRLTVTFTSLGVELPTITKGLIWFGDFIQNYGLQVLPFVVLGIVFIFYFFFIFKKTRFIGTGLLLVLPVSRGIMRNSEVARMGFILGVLLDAGLPILESLDAMAEATESRRYKKFYHYARKAIEDGQSFKEIFKNYKHARNLIPTTAQFMVISGEKSGSLPGALTSLGDAYEEKTNNHLRDITTVLEPAILIVVGAVVAVVALSILLPIYSLVGNLR